MDYTASVDTVAVVELINNWSIVLHLLENIIKIFIIHYYSANYMNQEEMESTNWLSDWACPWFQWWRESVKIKIEEKFLQVNGIWGSNLLCRPRVSLSYCYIVVRHRYRRKGSINSRLKFLSQVRTLIYPLWLNLNLPRVWLLFNLNRIMNQIHFCARV